VCVSVIHLRNYPYRQEPCASGYSSIGTQSDWL